MTKKDYTLIASYLKKIREPYGYKGGLDRDDDYRMRGIQDAMHAVADALAFDNPNFDRRRFLDACGDDGLVG